MQPYPLVDPPSRCGPEGRWTLVDRTRLGASLGAMGRLTCILASAVVAVAIAVTLAHGFRSQPPISVSVEAGQANDAQPPASSIDLPQEPRESRLNQSTVSHEEQLPSPSVDDRRTRRSAPVHNEATLRANMRKAATRDVQDAYSLLLEDLDLLPEEKEDLLAVLIEMNIERMSGGTLENLIHGKAISQQERHDRIAAAIGNKKLQELLALEQSLGAYWETQQIASLLRRRDVPLSEAQRDGVFAILIEVRDRYPLTESTDVDPLSLEHLENHLRQLDDVDRHVVELAPSFLSPTQVMHLDGAYQRMAYQRTNSLETQKKRRAERPGEELPWGYPARWSN